MIPVATITEIKNLDNKTKAGDLKKGFALMQQASRIAFDLVISEILKLHKQSTESSVLILCGKGNNGGDGLLTASYLIEQGYNVKCFLFAKPDELQDEAKMAYDYLVSVKKDSCNSIIEEKDLSLLKEFLLASDNHCFVLDALYGISYKTGSINKIFQQTTEIINSFQKGKTVIAIDGPSGIDNDNGLINHNPIKANYTLSMGFPKLGNFFFPARAFIGLMLVGDLKYTNEDVQACLSSKLYFIDNVKNFFPGRALNGSKYDHGSVVNIAGSKDMTGAAILSSKAAYKAGAGLVTLYTQNPQIVLATCPEVITKELDHLDLGNLLENQKIDCFAIGSGLGDNYKELVYELVAKSNKPLVLDADAINAFENCHEKLKDHKA